MCILLQWQGSQQKWKINSAILFNYNTIYLIYIIYIVTLDLKNNNCQLKLRNYLKLTLLKCLFLTAKQILKEHLDKND